MSTSKKRKNIKFIILLLVLCFIPSIIKFVDYGFQKHKLESQIDEFKTGIQLQEDLQREQLLTLSQVGTDGFYEEIAREHLGLIYPDEKILVLYKPNNQE